MAIEFLCPTCSGTLRVGDASAGRVVRCGACQTTLRVPGAPAPAPAAVPVAPPPEPQPPSAPAPARAARDPDPEFAPGPHAHNEPITGESERDDPDAAEREARADRNGDEQRDRDWDARRRRRRRPHPPPGRGALFWLALVGGVFTLLTCGCCGGLWLVLPGPKWQNHESARGGFRVDLPAPPRDDLHKFVAEKGANPDPDMRIEGTILFGRLEEYGVAYRDVPANERRGNSDKQLLDGAVQGMTQDGDTRVLSQKDVTVSGCAARELELRERSGGWFMARVIIADSRVYVLVAGGRFAQPGNENVRRFLDSFEITDPKLKDAGQRRPGGGAPGW
jgi:hypothetical protein